MFLYIENVCWQILMEWLGELYNDSLVIFSHYVKFALLCNTYRVNKITQIFQYFSSSNDGFIIFDDFILICSVYSLWSTYSWEISLRYVYTLKWLYLWKWGQLSSSIIACKFKLGQIFQFNGNSIYENTFDGYFMNLEYFLHE